jgi:hypothetical protein
MGKKKLVNRVSYSRLQDEFMLLLLLNDTEHSIIQKENAR